MFRQSIKDAILVLLNPSVWCNFNTYSPEWDEILSKLIQTEKFILEPGAYTAKIGPYEVWIDNHPYASMWPYDEKIAFNLDIRPKRATIIRAGKIIDKLKADNYKARLAAAGKALKDKQLK